MPHRHPSPAGHLIQGAIEFTIVTRFEKLGAHLDEEKYLGTFTDLEAAANFARAQWNSLCDMPPQHAGYHESIVAYVHTQGKTRYSRAHFKPLPWQDFDHCQADAATRRAAFWQQHLAPLGAA